MVTEVKNTRIEFRVETDQHVDYNDSVLDACVNHFLDVNRPAGVEVNVDKFTATRTGSDPLVFDIDIETDSGQHWHVTHTHDRGAKDYLVTIEVMAPGFREVDMAWLTLLATYTSAFFYEKEVVSFTMERP
jgi:hypothetical protein